MKNKILLLTVTTLCILVSFSFFSQASAIDIKAGPIWNNQDASKKCPIVCEDHRWHWNRNWHTTIQGKMSVCSCGWKFQKEEMEFIRPLTDNAQRKFDIFQNAIANRGLSPVQAAAEAGDTNYKHLGHDQYQIRLSYSQRATFLVDNKYHIVIMKQIGGHT